MASESAGDLGDLQPLPEQSSFSSDTFDSRQIERRELLRAARLGVISMSKEPTSDDDCALEDV